MLTKWLLGGVFVLGAALTHVGCMPTCMREAIPGEILTRPPPGKVLINFHRPSDAKGHVEYFIFNAGMFAGSTKGQMWFQYVCDPGTRRFIGRKKTWMGQVSVLEAEVVADRIYDCVIERIEKTFLLLPIAVNDPRRSQFALWEMTEEAIVRDFEEDAKATELEDRFRVANNEAIKDFTRGDKQDRLVRLLPEDGRAPRSDR